MSLSANYSKIEYIDNKFVQSKTLDKALIYIRQDIIATLPANDHLDIDLTSLNKYKGYKYDIVGFSVIVPGSNNYNNLVSLKLFENGDGTHGMEIYNNTANNITDDLVVNIFLKVKIDGAYV